MATIKDHYIRALEYADSKSEFTIKDLVTEISLSTIQETQLALQIHEKQIFQQNDSDYINNYKNRDIKLHLSVDDKFRLLNYVSLEEARSSSKEAKFLAIAAFVVSIFTSIISTCLSMQQINSEINIPTNFIKKIDEINKNSSEMKGSLSKVREFISVKRDAQRNEQRK